MARPNINKTLYGIRSWKDLWYGTVYNDPYPLLNTVETVGGVSRRLPAGWKDPTAYSLSLVTIKASTGSIEYRGAKTNWQKRYGCLGFESETGLGPSLNNYDTLFTVAATVPSGSDENRAIVKARNNLKGSRVNLGVAFGERKRTAHLIGSTASNIARSIRHLKRGQVRKAMNVLGITSSKREPRGANVPQKWLELQYGWKPLLNDVYGSVNALASRPAYESRVTAHATVESPPLTGFSSLTVQPSSYSGAGWTRGATTKRGVKVRLDAIPDNELKSSLSSLGVTNPLSVAWELVPFSFVVDWFAPVGNWLESIDALAGYTGVTQVTSRLSKAEWSHGGAANVVWGTWNYTNYSYSGAYRRSVLLSRSVGSATMPYWPGFKDPRSLGHMANGLALLCQVFGRGRDSWRVR